MKFLPDAASRPVAMQLLRAKANSPKLLFGVGVTGMVTSTVLACRATLRLQEVLEQNQGDLQVAKSLQHREYSEQDRQRDTAVIYSRTILQIGRLYLPAVGVGALSIACLTKSHNILTERNAGLTAAYIAVDKAFNRYRERVIERYGEDVDQEFRYELTDVSVVNDKGKQISTHKFAGPNAESMYARFFDEYSPNWSKEPEYNLLFLRSQQNYANDLLKARGHIFLNEVYDMLGIDRSRAGAVVGWLISTDGDNYIDFGFSENGDFINGREGSILLDFNVDGIIYDKIMENRKGTERLQWQS